MKGYLITNHFLKGEKFSELSRFLLEAAKSRGVELIPLTNAEMIAALPCSADACREYFSLSGISFVIFWDKDVRLARLIEQCGVRVFNGADAIERCDDKSLTYITLMTRSVAMPKTVISPKSFFAVSEYPKELIESLETKLGYPMIVKECYGSFGAEVYLAKDRDSLCSLIARTSPSPLIFQEYIAESFGRDYRLNVVGDKVVTAMERYNEGDFRANLTNGGSMRPYTPTREQEELAVSACSALGLDFAGVDILATDPPLLCEVNSNAHFVNIFKCTGVNVADFIIEYVIGKVGQ